MKNNIKAIALGALMVAGIFQASQVHAGLATLMPFAKRILLNSESFLQYAQGLWLKKLAEPYGLQCNYPALVKKACDDSACAEVRFIKTHKRPKIDNLGRVVLDQNDGNLCQTSSAEIFFDRTYVQQQLHYGNHKELIGSLFHEHEHLKKNHPLQRVTLKLQMEYAMQHRLAMALNNQPFEQDPEKYLLSVNRSLEEKADASMKDHPDLCLAFRDEMFEGRPYDAVHLHTAFGPNATIKELYTKAIKGDRDAYNALEKHMTHPLVMRRAHYLHEWLKEAEQKQGSKSNRYDHPYWTNYDFSKLFPESVIKKYFN